MKKQTNAFVNLILISVILFVIIKSFDIFYFDNSFIVQEEEPIISKSIPVKYTFYYDQLNPTEKQIYEAMLCASQNYEQKFYIGRNLKDHDINKTICAFFNDYPEFYWTNSVVVKIVGDKFYLEYEIEPNTKETVEKIKMESQKIVDSIPQNYSEYDKALYLYEYIINNTAYEENSEDNQDLRSVILYKKSVCGGYARTYQYLCNLAGIKCTTVNGSITDSETGETSNHAWNLVNLNNKYYWVDSTWGDSYEKNEDAKDLINYNFFLCDDSFLEGHEISDLFNYTGAKNTHFFIYPECNDNSLNYYIYKGYYIDNYDFEYIKKYFDKFLSEDVYQQIPIKCANKEIYDHIIEDLFENKNIWKIVSGYNFNSETLYYTYSKDEKNLIIYVQFSPE